MPRNMASADSPPPPISPSPTNPLSVSTSTIVRTKRPQCTPLACRSGASRGTVTVVARMSAIFTVQVYSSFDRPEYLIRDDANQNHGAHDREIQRAWDVEEIDKIAKNL